MFDFTEDQQNLICRFPQKMDTLNSQELELKMKEMNSGNGKKIVFDMDNVTFISSYFLRICFKIFRDAGEGNFKIINATSEIKKVLMIAGYDKFMDIH